MRDDAWWDGDDEDIVALQRRLLPLREAMVPWGDVLARARIASMSVPRRRLRYVTLAAAMAAGLVLVWTWTRSGTEAAPTRTDEADAALVEVAAPRSPAEVRDRDATREEIGAKREERGVLRPADADIASLPEPTSDSQRATKRVPRRRSDARTRAFGPATHDKAPAVEPAPFEIEIGPAAKLPSEFECAADPSRAGCDASLPDNLSSGDIRQAMAAIEEPARACGRAHSIANGTRVIVKLSVSGATGSVASSHAVASFADTAVGRCVAEAAAQAAFPRFRRATVAVMYPLVL